MYIELYEEPYTMYSLYIVEGNPWNIHKHQKFWKMDCPIDLSTLTSKLRYTRAMPAELFLSTPEIFGYTFDGDMTFTWYNLSRR